MKLLVVCRPYLQGWEEPPHRRVTKLIDWIGRYQEATGTFGSHETRAVIAANLEEARKFRTLLTHVAELPVHDWMTVQADPRSPILLRLFGSGSTPDQGVKNESDALPGDWGATAPFDSTVVECIMLVTYALFPFIGAGLARGIRPEWFSTQEPPDLPVLRPGDTIGQISSEPLPHPPITWTNDP